MLTPMNRSHGLLFVLAMTVMSPAAWAQIPPATELATQTSQDAHDGSPYVLPHTSPRTGVTTDEAFAALSQGGPWHTASRSLLTPVERQALDAAERGDAAALLKALKDQGLNPNVRDERGRTALSLMARQGDLAACRELVRRGARLDARGAEGFTPLAAASLGGHLLVVRELLDAGARSDEPSGNGQLPIHLAAAYGHADVMAMLMARGADPLAFNTEGRHALSEAARMGHIPLLALLVAQGVSPAAPDQFGLNALHAAALGKQPEAARWLQQKQVPVSGVMSQLLLDVIELDPFPAR
jgi:hypothetical protein